MSISYSIVIPLKDEEEAIIPLLKELEGIGEKLGDCEILLVDDGSKDRTWPFIKEYAKEHPRVRSLRLDQNHGQSAALLCGFLNAKGEHVITLDGDGQNVPQDIFKLIDKMTPEVVLVTGVRVQREDSWLKRKISRYANAIRGRFLEDYMRDTGCSLKLLKKAKLLELPFFNGMHRFLPALFMMRGYKVVEVEVDHRPRRLGVSKYGIRNRSLKPIIDLFGVFWLKRRIIQYRIVEETSSL